LKTEIWARSWSASHYEGLRQFHQGKGFVADSQDVARHLGYPLYDVVPGYREMLAHSEWLCFSSPVLVLTGKVDEINDVDMGSDEEAGKFAPHLFPIPF
jgi:hypothetical protein